MQHLLPALAAYNDFQRKRQPALRCAVRQDLMVPVLIQSNTWEFGGTANVEQLLTGFHPQAAEDATRYIGYYLFYALGR